MTDQLQPNVGATVTDSLYESIVRAFMLNTCNNL
jgi:hypothetical protein